MVFGVFRFDLVVACLFGFAFRCLVGLVFFLGFGIVVLGVYGLLQCCLVDYL